MDEKKWFLYVVDHHEGPFSLVDIRDLLEQGKTTTEAFVWREGMDDWTPMASLPDFAPILGPQEPSLTSSQIIQSPTQESSLTAEPLFVIDPSPEPKSSVKTSSVEVARESATKTLNVSRDAADVSIRQLSHSDTGYCLFSEREYTGPFSFKAVIRKVNQGEVGLEDKLWHPGWSDFVMLGAIREIKEQTKPPEKRTRKKIKNASGKRSFVFSPLFIFFFFIVLPLSAYQFLAKGGGTFLAERTPIKSLATVHLPPLPFDAAWQMIHPYFSKTGQKLSPLLSQFAGYAPKDMQGYLSPIPFIEGLSPEDVTQMRDVATQPIQSGLSVAVIKKPQSLESGFPQFYIATNAPEGTVLTLQLLGKAGSLVGAPAYIKSTVMDITKGYGLTPRFTADEGKSLVRGDYVFTVEESDGQTAEVTKILNQAPVRSGSKKLHHVEIFFVGGKKDEAYRQALQEYNESIRQKKLSEVTELDQILSTMMDAGKEISEYLAIAGQPGDKPKKKRDPREVQLRQRADQAKKILEQVGLKVFLPKETLEKTYVLGGVYVRTGDLLGQLRRATHVQEAEATVSQLGDLRKQIQAE